jgi:hypothetical protein
MLSWRCFSSLRSSAMHASSVSVVELSFFSSFRAAGSQCAEARSWPSRLVHHADGFEVPMLTFLLEDCGTTSGRRDQVTAICRIA